MRKTFTIWAILGRDPLTREDVVIFAGNQKEVETLYKAIMGGAFHSVDVSINNKIYSVYGYGSKRFYNPLLYPNREKAPLGLINQFKDYSII